MSETPVVAFEATEVQAKLFEYASDGRYRYIGFGGGIRGAKTWGGLGMLVTLCRIFPQSRWAVVRKDLPRLRQNTVPSFNKLRHDYFGTFVQELNQSTWTYRCDNGSEIVLFPESLDQDPDLSRWKGLEVNGFLLEEADELAEKSFHKAIERAGAWIVPNGGTQPPPLIFVTFNPCANWPKHVFYEPWKNGTIAAPFAFVPATAADNPHIPDATREGWRSLPEQEYRRFVEGDWDVLSGRYYNNLDPRVHKKTHAECGLTNGVPSWWTTWGSYDWGYRHWAVYGAWAQDGDGTAYLLDSLWMRMMQDDDMAQEIVAFVPDKGCLAPVYAGGDCFAAHVARGASGVPTSEVFARAGIALSRADANPANGGRAVRRLLDFKRNEAGIFTKFPRVIVLDTPGNARVLSQLAEIMPDENNINAPAKIDADAEGRGGDDGADMFRFGLASHPPLAVDPTPIADPVDRAPKINWKTGTVKRVKAETDLDRAIARESRAQTTPTFKRPRW